jgi:hypothetical protein
MPVTIPLKAIDEGFARITDGIDAPKAEGAIPPVVDLDHGLARSTRLLICEARKGATGKKQSDAQGESQSAREGPGSGARPGNCVILRGHWISSCPRATANGGIVRASRSTAFTSIIESNERRHPWTAVSESG